MSSYHYVFGPVPSRRLGRSLGVDVIPLKTCNWNCAYCQLGRTRHLVNDRRPYGDVDDILGEVRDALAENSGAGSSGLPGIDWVTFVGSGEPLLNSDLGRLISGVKQLTDLPVAVLTNGALLHDVALWDELAEADAILPSLDAGSASVYRRINRPHPHLDFERYIDGLVAFSQGFAGRVWVEVMLVKGLNDGDQAVGDIAAVLDWIRVDEVQVNTPVRPAAEAWVGAPEPARVAEIVHVLSTRARGVPIPAPSLLSHEPEPSPVQKPRVPSEVAESIASVVSRHPMRAEEIGRLMGCAEDEIESALAYLRSRRRIQAIDRQGARFWGPAGASYARPRAGESSTDTEGRISHAER